jgi:hypothetical protein
VTKARISFIVVIICTVAFANMPDADDSIRGFTQQTLDGEIIKSDTLKGMPMVINIGSHW